MHAAADTQFGSDPCSLTVCRSFRRLIIAALAVTLIAANPSAARAGSLVPGNVGALDYIAFAVDGAESSHGSDRNMWRPEPDGPQGPMQVSAAAAEDVGGGNRFDTVREPSALAGLILPIFIDGMRIGPTLSPPIIGDPVGMDAWIGAGRPSDKFPMTVSLYRMRVLFGSAASNSTLGSRFGIGRRTPRRPLADRLHPSRESVEVEQLYTTIMSQTERFAR